MNTQLQQHTIIKVHMKHSSYPAFRIPVSADATVAPIKPDVKGMIAV